MIEYGEEKNWAYDDPNFHSGRRSSRGGRGCGAGCGIGGGGGDDGGGSQLFLIII